MKVEIVDERGHLHYFPADTHQALVDIGLIWREGDRWRMASATGDLGAFPELAVCDFCGQRPVTWDVAVDDFTISGKTPEGPTTFNSTQGWLACEPCGGLIASQQVAALLQRSLAIEGHHNPAAVVVLHAHFWKHYKGIRRYPPPDTEAP
jgi:hypothetical protein